MVPGRVVLVLALATSAACGGGDAADRPSTASRGGDGADRGPAASPGSWQVFTFDSGGAHHFEGYGAWRVRIERGRVVRVEHQVRSDTRTWSEPEVPAADLAAVWSAVDAAALADLDVDERPGVPDEARLAFGLERENADPLRIEIWQNDVREHASLSRVLPPLRTLIEKATGETPVF